MAFDAKKYVGAVPYVFPTSVAGEFSSDFIPLESKAGYFLLDESSGAYYVTAVGTGTNVGKTVLKFDSNRPPLVALGTPPATIDGLAPFSSLTDVTVKAANITGGVFDPAKVKDWDAYYDDNRAYDVNGKPLYTLGFDYKQYAVQLFDWAKTPAGTWYTAAAAKVTTGTAKDVPTLIEYGVKPTAVVVDDAYKIQCWTRAGELFKAVVAHTGLDTELTAPNDKDIIALAAGGDPTAQHPNKRIAQLGDYLTDKISLDSTGLPFVSLPAVEANAVSGRNPQRGPFDYLVTKDGKYGLEEGTAPKEVVDALAAATTDAEKMRAIRILIPASVQEFPTFTGVVTRPALDKAIWDAPLTVSGVKFRWAGENWVIVP